MLTKFRNSVNAIKKYAFAILAFHEKPTNEVISKEYDKAKAHVLNFSEKIKHLSPNSSFWYDPVHDCVFPKCSLCKGKRDELCPKECMGDK